MSESVSSYDFSLDPSYVEIQTIKRIGIDPTSNSIAVEINTHLVLQTIHLDDFADKTIKPLKKQLREVLDGNKNKPNVINSVVSCINRNINLIRTFNEQFAASEPNNIGDTRGTKDAQFLVDLASRTENTELFFKDQYGQPYVAVRIGKDKHLEIMSLKSDKYNHYLGRLFRENRNGQIIGKDTIQQCHKCLGV